MISASVLGTSSAAAIPCTARAPISVAASGASAQTSEAMPKPITPSSKIRAAAEHVSERAADEQ